MTNAIVQHETVVPDPGPDQIAIRRTAIGANYIDTYMRAGLDPVGLPSVIGQQ